MKTGLLLSGGMDSISIAWWKRPQWAVTIDYGQRAAKAEICAARQVCEQLGIEHEILTIDCSSLGSGDLSGRKPHPIAQTSDWWPYRNQLIITLACMSAISRGVRTLYIGTVNSDAESHTDGTPEFVRRIDELISYQEAGLRVQAPAIDFSTPALVKEAQVPPGLLAWAHSCHTSNIACGQCRGCNKYINSFAELGGEYCAA